MAFTLVVLANSSQAQLRPSDEPPELPEFAPDEEERSLLPPVPMPPEEERLSTGRRIVVRDFEVRGSSVFSEEELAQLTAPYEGRELDMAELGLVRNAITARYVDAGYVTSGAVISDQEVTDGVVVIEVIEGTLDDIAIEGNHWLRSKYLRGRIERGIGAPVNVYELEEQLQLLQRKELIQSVNAQLDPGSRRGESTLSVLVNEARPARFAVGAANDKSPSIGSTGGKLWLRHLSLTRNGDVLGTRGEFTEGYWDVDTFYSFPLNARDTTLVLNYRRTGARVVESPFDALDIESDAATYGIALRHPLIQTLRQELWLGLGYQYRESETEYLFGDFPSQECDNGECALHVLRLPVEWTHRTPKRVMAARSTVSIGFDAFEAATVLEPPDSTFVAWLLQLQMVQLLPERFWGSQVVFRGNLQLASGPLLSFEQYALGGLRSVRGYRENALVRDNGLLGSLELRIPLFRDWLPLGELQLAPFLDVGYAWDDGVTQGPKTLSSLGVGLRYQLLDRVLAELYWGGRLRSVPRRGDDILQNNGWSFNVRIDLW